jgi:hypothetical protein
MPSFGRGGSLPLSFPLGAIFAGIIDFALADIIGHFAGFLGGHSTICAASEMGRMDSARLNHPDSSLGSGDVCYAKDAGISKSPQEADCGKCRDERRELLYSTSPGSEDPYTDLCRRAHNANG